MSTTCILIVKSNFFIYNSEIIDISEIATEKITSSFKIAKVQFMFFAYKYLFYNQKKFFFWITNNNSFLHM